MCSHQHVSKLFLIRWFLVHIALLSETRHVEWTWALWWACRSGGIDGGWWRCPRSYEPLEMRWTRKWFSSVWANQTRKGPGPSSCCMNCDWKVGQSWLNASSGSERNGCSTWNNTWNVRGLELFVPFLRRANSELLGFVASILELKEDQAISGNLVTLTELRASKSLNPQNQTRDPVKSLSMFQCPMGRLGFVFFLSWKYGRAVPCCHFWLLLPASSTEGQAGRQREQQEWLGLETDDSSKSIQDPKTLGSNVRSWSKTLATLVVWTVLFLVQNF